MLVERMRPERSLSHAPLFQVMFVLQEVPPAVRMPALGVEPQRGRRPDDEVRPTLAVLEESRRGAARGTLEYDAELFEEGTVERLAAHLLNLLDSAVTSPAARLTSLALLDELRAHRISTASTPRAALPARRRCTRLFERQAAETPAAAALAWRAARSPTRSWTRGRV